MFNDLTSLLKINLAFISSFLCCLQVKNKNKDLARYWMLVALYWIFNFLSGLNLK